MSIRQNYSYLRRSFACKISDDSKIDLLADDVGLHQLTNVSDSQVYDIAVCSCLIEAVWFLNCLFQGTVPDVNLSNPDAYSS